VPGRDTDEEKAVALASAAVIGKDPGLANTELDHYLTATPADIQRVAKDYFQSSRATVLIVTPAAPGAPGASSQQ
jgi:predicted Zn-dependent peptidase